MLAYSSLNTANRKQQIESWEASDMNKEIVNPRPPERVNFPIDVQFHAACKNADLDEVKSLLSQGVDINVTNVDGLTVLHQACIDENYDVVQFLLRNKADVNAQDNEGWTPLHACASCAYPELAKLLLEHGAGTGIVSFELELPLDVAQGKEMVALLKDWMQRQSVDENAARSAEEQQMLHDAQEWLRTGEYSRVVDPRTGATALHIAAAKGYSDVLELLLKLPDVDVDATDMDGWTPLHAAAHWAKEKPLRLLAAAGASFDIITLTNQSIYDVADRSVTMLLRQLRNEQQRSAAAAAIEGPVISLPTRRKAEDEDEKKSEASAEQEPMQPSRPPIKEEEIKPLAPKLAKIEELEKRTGTSTEEQAEEAEEEAKKASDLLNKHQKDEVALKAKKHEGVLELSKNQLEKRSSSPPTKVDEQASGDDVSSKETVSITEESTSSKKPSPSPTAPKTSSTSSIVPPAESTQMMETAVNLDTTNASTGGAPNRSSRHGKKDNTAIKRISAVLAPARSEETEAQRSNKARLVRSTRRSTQGIANDVLEEAMRLSSTDNAVASTPTTSAAVFAPTPIQTNRKQPVDAVTLSAASVPTTHVSKATITPAQPSAASSTAPSGDTTPSSIIAHSRARRATRDRVPTGKLSTSDVLAAAKQLELDAAAGTSDGTAPATSSLPSDPIPRPTTRLLRSTILNTTPTSTNNSNGNEVAISNGSGDRRDSPADPQFCTSAMIKKPADQRYNWREDSSESEVTTTKSLENLDYRLLYEEERSEKERLKRTLDQVSHEVNMLRSELAKIHLSASNTATIRSSGSIGDPTVTQQNTMEYYENQAKEIDRLRIENARMADENKSLIRVISKLSARTTT